MLLRILSVFGMISLILPCEAVVAQTRVANRAVELNWAEKMFSDLKIDFGTVARGADTRHDLVIENLYEEDVEIVNVGTTCGCTAAKPDKTRLKTHEQAHVEVVMNTTKFTNRKDSNVDVTLRFYGSQGSATKTVRVPITAFIRTDVVLTPGNADFGSVEYGQPVEKIIDVAYAGRNDWKITGVKSGHENVIAEVVETSRANGRVNYQLKVRLSEDSQIGLIQDRLILTTDDRNSPEVPVLVTGRVAPDIEILPNEYTLGRLAPGEVKEFKVVVKGKRDFSISNIECDAHPDAFEVKPQTATPKPVHVVPFRFTAPDQPGEFSEVFTLTIEGRPKPLTFAAKGIIQSGS